MSAGFTQKVMPEEVWEDAGVFEPPNKEFQAMKEKDEGGTRKRTQAAINEQVPVPALSKRVKKDAKAEEMLDCESPVADLKRRLGEMGLPIYGTKKQLWQRLSQASFPELLKTSPAKMTETDEQAVAQHDIKPKPQVEISPSMINEEDPMLAEGLDLSPQGHSSEWEGFVVGGDRVGDALRRLLEDKQDPHFVIGLLTDDERQQLLQSLTPKCKGQLTNDDPGETMEVELEPPQSLGPCRILHEELLAQLPAEFGVLLVVGPSGSGVTSALHQLRTHYNVAATPTATFGHHSSVASEVPAARDWFPRVGLNDIKAWCQPYQTLSNGQRQRVRLARHLAHVCNVAQGIVIDDLGMAVDEADGRAIGHSLGRLFRARHGGKPWGRVLIGTHTDLAAYLQPDWVLQLTGDRVSPKLWPNIHPTQERNVQLSVRIGDMGPLKIPEDDAEKLHGSSTRHLVGRLSDPDSESVEVCEWQDLISKVRVDEQTLAAAAAFELEFTGTIKKKVACLPSKWIAGSDWKLGLVVGPSGSGKTTNLRQILQKNAGQEGLLGTNTSVEQPWENHKPIQVALPCSPEQRDELLSLVGLAPETWQRPFVSLSNSEKSRATLARALAQCACISATGETPPAVLIDEFTTELDRCSAHDLCKALQSFVKQSSVQLILATVFEDVCGWLGSTVDWMFLTNRGLVVPNPSSPARQPCQLPEIPNLHPPKLEVELSVVVSADEKQKLWKEYFHEHHYLSGGLLVSSTVILARETQTRSPVAFLAVKTFPGKQFCECHRGHSHMKIEHRLVVRPSWQNFGLGTALSDEAGKRYTTRGEKYVGKTAHPRLALHRERSMQWKQHGNFLADITHVKVKSNGWVELQGPKLQWQAPTQHALIFTLCASEEMPAEALLALQGRRLTLDRKSKKNLCFQVQCALSCSPGDYCVHGQAVFYQPENQNNSCKKGIIAQLNDIGPRRMKLKCLQDATHGPMLHYLAERERGHNAMESAPAKVVGLSNAKQAFQAVALLAFAGAGTRAEENNIRLALQRIRAGATLPDQILVAVQQGLRLPHSVVQTVAEARPMRVTFSHEYIPESFGQ